MVFLILVFKGASGEGQASFLSGFIRQYVEESSASIISYAQSPLIMADISSLTALNTSELGQGGPEVTLDPATINNNSFIAYNPPSSDYIETSGIKRNSVTEYTVQEGDVLSFIASDYGVSMNTIIWANNLKDAHSIKPGQILKIPPVSGVIHSVKKGDTLGSLAKKYGADESKISEFNSLPKDGSLQIGEQLIIPDGQIKATATTMASTATRTTKSAFSYLPNLGDFFMLPATGFNWGKIHGRNGVDVANKCGSPIFAAATGTVIVADATGYNGGFGKYIKMIHDNGTETLYAHATKLLVEQGAKVEKGQQIALMGSTGRSTGCHIHFEVHGARNPLAKY